MFSGTISLDEGKRIGAMVGGWDVTVNVDSTGEIIAFLPEFIPFYVMVKNDYVFWAQEILKK
jgi:hypothetical protein